jgi:hypothetical protein
MTAEFLIFDGQLSFVLHEVPYREPEFTFAERDRRFGKFDDRIAVQVHQFQGGQ